MNLNSGFVSRNILTINNKKFAKIGLSIPGGGGFKPGFCCAPVFFIAHAFRAKPRQDITAPWYTGLQVKLKLVLNMKASLKLYCKRRLIAIPLSLTLEANLHLDELNRRRIGIYMRF